MSTVNVKIPAGVWVNITNGATDGTLEIVQGKAVRLTQATALPTGQEIVAHTLKPREFNYLFGPLPAGADLYGFVLPKPVYDGTDGKRVMGGASIVAVSPI